MKNPLLDKEFLYELDQNHNREVFAKIISLDFEENPIEEIVGRISQGSISIDGNSAMRRTCSLTVVANKSNGEDFNLHEYYWGLSQKIRISIGVTNTINPDYPEIVWFPQGTFLITQFNTSQNINSYSISIQGKDKMALLNGELGGNITALSVDFGTQDYVNSDGSVTNTSLLLKDIIKEVVHEYAKEPYHNIVINDLDDVGLELMEYRGTAPLYLIVDQTTNEVEQMVLDDNFKLWKKEGKTIIPILIGSLEDDEYDHRIELNLEGSYAPLYLYSKDDLDSPKSIIKCTYGDVIGYKITDLTYAGDLVGQVGNPVTSACLDNIVKMLGDFEYFYNLDGQFVFQKKKTYINTSFNNIQKADRDFIAVNIKNQEEFEAGTYYLKNTNGQVTQDYSLDVFNTNVLSLYSTNFILATEYDKKKTYYKRVYVDGFANTMAESSSVIYSFENSNLVTSFQNNPSFSNVKNDFSIWGQRKSVDSSSNLPVHMRYAIDKKPVYYKNYEGKIFISKEYNDDKNIKKKYESYDWRELIYQMAVDYSLYNHEDDFLPTIRLNNLDYYPTGYTGYESYYTDILSFWRQLYYPKYESNYTVTSCTAADFNMSPENYYWYKQCDKNDKFSDEETYYILDIHYGYSSRPSLTKDFYSGHESNYYILRRGDENSIWDSDTVYYKKTSSDFNENYWSKTITESPETLNFWFDFLDGTGQFAQYSCRLIGNRPKAINENTVKSIYFRETPTIILTDDTISNEELKEQKQLKTGYVFLKVPSDMKNLFTISGQGQSAKDKLESLLYSDACCAESVTINAIPVYYLEPNTRIFVRDDESGINGEYIVSKISYNLGAAATMNVSATRAIERIY